MTVRSMTGFANAQGEIAGKRIELELRAVNHRFLDVQFKIPDDLRVLEGTMREIISGKVSRGKIEMPHPAGQHRQRRRQPAHQPKSGERACRAEQQMAQKARRFGQARRCRYF